MTATALMTNAQGLANPAAATPGAAAAEALLVLLAVLDPAVPDPDEPDPTVPLETPAELELAPEVSVAVEVAVSVELGAVKVALLRVALRDIGMPVPAAPLAPAPDAPAAAVMGVEDVRLEAREERVPLMEAMRELTDDAEIGGRTPTPFMPFMPELVDDGAAVLDAEPGLDAESVLDAELLEADELLPDEPAIWNLAVDTVRLRMFWVGEVGLTRVIVFIALRDEERIFAGRKTRGDIPVIIVPQPSHAI